MILIPLVVLFFQISATEGYALNILLHCGRLQESAHIHEYLSILGLFIMHFYRPHTSCGTICSLECHFIATDSFSSVSSELWSSNMHFTPELCPIYKDYFCFLFCIVEWPICDLFDVILSAHKRFVIFKIQTFSLATTASM